MPQIRTVPPNPAQAGLAAVCAVSLIDRRTGRPHRVNGAPLVVFTRSPDIAASDLLQGRDRAIWETRIERLGGRAPL